MTFHHVHIQYARSGAFYISEDFIAFLRSDIDYEMVSREVVAFR